MQTSHLSGNMTLTKLVIALLLTVNSEKYVTQGKEFKIQRFKPSLSMKILSINNFTIKLLSKLLRDLYIVVHLKGTKQFGSKVINRQFFHRKTVFSYEYIVYY